MPSCLNCASETSNPKFCSRSCSATSTNSTHKKRKPKARPCKRCGGDIVGGRAVICLDCSEKFKNRTLQDYLCEGATASKFAKVRGHARFVASVRVQVCQNCAYDKHVEVCHVKDICSFPMSALISEINHEDNLVLLCPNCHWEFDNGLLHLD